MILMTGKEVVNEMLKNKKCNAKKVAIFVNEEDEASKVYVKNKSKKFESIGIECDLISTNEDLWKVHSEVAKLKEKKIPYMFQLPLSNNILSSFCDNIPLKLDIDSMGMEAQGAFYKKPDAWNTPCTPLGIYFMLKHYIPEDKLLNKNVVVIGRSAIVGRPMARVMEYYFNSTVTVCHSKTNNLEFYTKNADIIIIAIGKANFLTVDMIKKDAILVDVGINRDINGKLCGDVNFESCKEKAYAISPVPKGVGVTTVGSLVYKCLL